MLTNNNGDERNNHHRNGNDKEHQASVPLRAAGVGISDAPFYDDDDPPVIRRDVPLDKKAQGETTRDETAPPDDVLTTDVVDLTDADAQATPDIKRRGQGKGSFFKRLLIAFAAIFLIALIVILAAYFVFFRTSAKGDLTFQRKRTAVAAAQEEQSKAPVSAEEIGREMAGAKPSQSPNVESGQPSSGATVPSFQSATPGIGSTYPALGGEPVTSRLPNESFSTTVDGLPQIRQAQVQSAQETPEGATTRSGGNSTAATSPRAERGLQITGTGANPERSIRAVSLRNVSGEGSGNQARVIDQSDSSANRKSSPTRSRLEGNRSAVASPTVALPPLGTMIPVRTLGTIYTLRADTLVRMQVTRTIDGNGWSLKRGTELYGVLRGSDYETGRAYISLVGFVDPKTNALVRVSGNLLGSDGADGVRGRKHRLNSRWSNGLRIAGAGALDVFGTLASAFGRRPIIVSDVYGVANQRTVSPLLQELRGEAAGKERAGFIEVPASTSGYVLVLTMPRSVQGVDAPPRAIDAINLSDLSGNDLERFTSDPETSAASELTDAELSELLTTGTPQQIRAALGRMSPAMRHISEQVLAQGL
ncbi:MAG: hypothetical protein MSG64_19505 [Pyrinomonadaceae bacterium MAG19_C2-C3]|nr:hypothetical protein [Pyrinomonadaceae bacterium MAG19_C2-C3]